MPKKIDSLGRRRQPTQSNGPKPLPKVSHGSLTGKLSASKVPQSLDAAGKAFWRMARTAMDQMGILETPDQAGLEIAADNWQRMQQARKLIKQHGLLIAGPQGIIKNPAISIAKDCQAMLRSYLSNLGLTPTARAKLGGTETEVDPFEAPTTQANVTPFRKKA